MRLCWWSWTYFTSTSANVKLLLCVLAQSQHKRESSASAHVLSIKWDKLSNCPTEFLGIRFPEHAAKHQCSTKCLPESLPVTFFSLFSFHQVRGICWDLPSEMLALTVQGLDSLKVSFWADKNRAMSFEIWLRWCEWISNVSYLMLDGFFCFALFLLMGKRTLFHLAV